MCVSGTSTTDTVSRPTSLVCCFFYRRLISLSVARAVNIVNCSNRNLDKLQRVQDNLARVVCNSNRSASAGPLLRSLHCLPVRQRINFKLAKLCYLVTCFRQPGYLADLISPYSQSRSLWSSTQKFLSVPPHNLDTAARRFSVEMLQLLTHLRPGLRHFSLLRHNPHCSTRLCTMARYKCID